MVSNWAPISRKEIIAIVTRAAVEAVIGERMYHLAHDRGRTFYSSFGTAPRRGLFASLAGGIGRRRALPQ
jgi:hypothetical protein